jgi:hypothetical protein
MINLSPSRLSSPDPLTRRRCHLSTDTTPTGEVTLIKDAMHCAELTDTTVSRLYSSCTRFELQMFNRPFVLACFPNVRSSSSLCVCVSPLSTFVCLKQSLLNLYLSLGSRDSSVGIATCYELEDRGVGVRVPAGSRIFHVVQTGTGAHGTLFPKGTKGSFPGG